MSPARRTHTGFLDKSVLVDPRSSAGPLFVWTSSYSQFHFGRRFAPQRPPQHHHPPRLGPSSQLQHVLSPLPSLPRIHPVLFAENLSDELLHIPALLELE